MPFLFEENRRRRHLALIMISGNGRKRRKRKELPSNKKGNVAEEDEEMSKL